MHDFWTGEPFARNPFDVPGVNHDVGYRDEHDNLLAEVAAGKAERLRLRELREKGLLRD